MGPRRAVNLRSLANQLVAELDGALTDMQADELARRHGLVRIESQNFPLIGATIGLFRITDNRPADLVSRELATEAGIRTVQLNFRIGCRTRKCRPKAIPRNTPSQNFACRRPINWPTA